MKLSPLATKSLLIRLTMLLIAPVLIMALFRMSSHASTKNTTPNPILNRTELHTLEGIAWRMESMLTLANYTRTHVWPHAVRDSKGRAGLFISSSAPLLEAKDGEKEEMKRAWTVLGLVAAVKYAVGSPIKVGHIAFTDSDGIEGDRWYYDLDFGTAREIHRRLISGDLKATEAHDLIAACWIKITAHHDLAVK
jgi:hypothetical protein